MLLLKRNKGQKIVIGDNIKVIVLDIKDGNVRLGIDTPEGMDVKESTDIFITKDENSSTEKKIPFQPLSFFQDEIIFISGLAIVWSLIATSTITSYLGLLICLLVILGLALYYSITFFRDDRSWYKLYFYVVMSFVLIGYFALMYKAFGVITPDSNGISKPLDWLNALYFSVVTWTTLGYGDFRPENDATKIFVMTEALLGYIYMGVFIGKLLLLGQGKNEKGINYV
jgi:carbon storage regulator CsrA